LRLLLLADKQIITDAEFSLHEKVFFSFEQIFGEKSGAKSGAKSRATLGQKVGQLFSIDI
jgi:hypothetical protein